MIVEGKYDKIKLQTIFDAVIITTNGFGIYKDREKAALIRHYAATTGIIILTDSDTAGFRIRQHLKGTVGGNIKNVYIPEIFGKERRKAVPSKEGKLGVEGIDNDIIIEAFRRAGITAAERDNSDPITRADMYELGYSGKQNSSARRRELLGYLDLPVLLTTTAMTELLNTMMSRKEFYSVTQKLFGDIKSEV